MRSRNHVTLREAARSLDASQAHVIALLARGDLRAVEGAGKLRIDRAEFDAYVRGRLGAEATQPAPDDGPA